MIKSELNELSAKSRENVFFNSPTLGRLDFNRLIEEIKSFAAEKSSAKYDIIVGSDSENHADGVDFISAVIVYRHGFGGRYFWRRIRADKKMEMRDRIYQEAVLSLASAQQLMEILKKINLPDYNLEIHVDIGANGPTRKMINEVVGMIRGSGFNVKTKPESYAASCVADRHC